MPTAERASAATRERKAKEGIVLGPVVPGEADDMMDVEPGGGGGAPVPRPGPAPGPPRPADDTKARAEIERLNRQMEELRKAYEAKVGLLERKTSALTTGLRSTGQAASEEMGRLQRDFETALQTRDAAIRDQRALYEGKIDHVVDNYNLMHNALTEVQTREATTVQELKMLFEDNKVLQDRIRASENKLGGIQISGPDAGQVIRQTQFAEQQKQLDLRARELQAQQEQLTAQKIRLESFAKSNAQKTETEIASEMAIYVQRGEAPDEIFKKLFARHPDKAVAVKNAVELYSAGLVAANAAKPASLARSQPLVAQEIKDGAQDAKAFLQPPNKLELTMEAIAAAMAGFTQRAAPSPAQLPPAPAPAAASNVVFNQLNQLNIVGSLTGASQQTSGPNVTSASGGVVVEEMADDDQMVDDRMFAAVSGRRQLAIMPPSDAPRPAGESKGSPETKVADGPGSLAMVPVQPAAGPVQPARGPIVDDAPASAALVIPDVPDPLKKDKKRGGKDRAQRTGVKNTELPEKERQQAMQLDLRKKGEEARELVLQERKAKRSLQYLTGTVAKPLDEDYKNYMAQVQQYYRVANEDLKKLQRDDKLAADYESIGKLHDNAAQALYDMKFVYERKIDKNVTSIPAVNKAGALDFYASVRDALQEAGISPDNGNSMAFLSALAKDDQAGARIPMYFRHVKNFLAAPTAGEAMDILPDLERANKAMYRDMQRVGRSDGMQALASTNTAGVAAPPKPGPSIKVDDTKDITGPAAPLAITDGPTPTAAAASLTESQVVLRDAKQTSVTASVTAPTHTASTALVPASSDVVPAAKVVNYFEQGVDRIGLTPAQVVKVKSSPVVRQILDELRDFVTRNQRIDINVARNRQVYIEELSRFYLLMMNSISEAVALPDAEEDYKMRDRLTAYGQGLPKLLGGRSDLLRIGAPPADAAKPATPRPVVIASPSRAAIGAPPVRNLLTMPTEIVSAKSKNKRKDREAAQGLGKAPKVQPAGALVPYGQSPDVVPMQDDDPVTGAIVPRIVM
jgi:hypothetical protein